MAEFKKPGSSCLVDLISSSSRTMERNWRSAQKAALGAGWFSSKWTLSAEMTRKVSHTWQFQILQNQVEFWRPEASFSFLYFPSVCCQHRNPDPSATAETDLFHQGNSRDRDRLVQSSVLAQGGLKYIFWVFQMKRKAYVNPLQGLLQMCGRLFKQFLCRICPSIIWVCLQHFPGSSGESQERSVGGRTPGTGVGAVCAIQPAGGQFWWNCCFHSTHPCKPQTSSQCSEGMHKSVHTCSDACSSCDEPLLENGTDRSFSSSRCFHGILLRFLAQHPLQRHKHMPCTGLWEWNLTWNLDCCEWKRLDLIPVWFLVKSYTYDLILKYFGIHKCLLLANRQKGKKQLEIKARGWWRWYPVKNYHIHMRSIIF